MNSAQDFSDVNSPAGLSGALHKASPIDSFQVSVPGMSTCHSGVVELFVE